MTWDPHYTGKISKWQDLQGAMNRINVRLTEDEARALLHLYDKDGTGEMHYKYVIEDLTAGAPANVTVDLSTVPQRANITSRAPGHLYPI